MELLSNSPSGSVFEVIKENGKHDYYIHHFLTIENIYGTYIQYNSHIQKLIKNIDFVKKYDDITDNNMCSELIYDDDNQICNQDYEKIKLKLLYKSEMDVVNYVTFDKEEFDELKKHNVNFYCDYMDQGFEILEHVNEIWFDTTGKSSKTGNYCSGETPYVNLNELNKVLSKNYTFMDRMKYEL